jgi:tight adherence protein B
MGALLGLTFALGVLLIWAAIGAPRRAPSPGRRTPAARVAELTGQAGLGSIGPAGFAAACVALGLAAFLVMAGVSRSAHIGLAFALGAAYAPVAVLRGRARRRRATMRDLWPEVVDNLASAIRAGMSLPEAVTAIGDRGPEALREPFRRFGADYRATGRFDECLETLKSTLADPTADRVIESLRLARAVGGSDLGRLLRTLSGFLREDARTRAELESRQSWTVNAARLAVAAPWAVLAMLALRPAAVEAYNAPGGLIVLGAGAGVCALAYRLMILLGRLPVEERVLR